MKKISIMFLLAVLAIIGLPFETQAKTAKKATTNKPQIVVEFDADAHPIIVGHAYRCTLGRYWLELEFEENDIVKISTNSNGKVESKKGKYVKSGQGVDVYEDDTYEPNLILMLYPDGKSMVSNYDYLFKIVK